MEAKRVLLVDDDELIIKLLEIMLKARGFQVESNLGGVGAFEKARQVLPDCIILDIMMPRVDGWKVLESLKKDAATRPIPVIILSVKAAPDDVFKGEELGAARFLSKPFEADDLVRAIDDIT
ncbi:MAG: response regulator [Candidatus Geothermincolia bacterium]